MDSRIQAWLSDIDTAIEEIFSFLPDKMDFNEFQNDLKTRKAVERNIEIIGEAVNRIKKSDSKIEIANSQRIIGTRNRIAHDYDNISVEIIWAIVNRELPLLQKEIKDLMN